jgi:hypothetical protein
MNAILKKLGAGNYQITITKDFEKVGSFNLTDMQILSDIEEFKNSGFESELTHFQNFKEVENYCLTKAKN